MNICGIIVMHLCNRHFCRPSSVSLAGCSPAEPDSVSLDRANIRKDIDIFRALYAFKNSINKTFCGSKNPFFSILGRVENHIKWFEHYLDSNGITKGGHRAGILSSLGTYSLKGSKCGWPSLQGVGGCAGGRHT